MASKPIELIPKTEGNAVAVVVPLSASAADGKASIYAVRKADGTNLLSVNAATSTIELAALGSPLKMPSYADDTARDAAITSPSLGMLVYNIDSDKLQLYGQSGWVNVGSGL